MTANIGNTARGTAELLNWLVNEHGIEPHIPEFDDSTIPTAPSRATTSPMTTSGTATFALPGSSTGNAKKSIAGPRPVIDRDCLMRYRASKPDCQGCSLKPRCCPNAPARKIPRSIHQGARDMARDIAQNDAYRTSRCQREKVGMLFVHLKRILKLDHLRLRGPNGARDEFHLAVTAQTSAISPS